MEDESVCYLSATEMVKMIKTKKISPVEIVQALLERIERLNPKINAYCTILADLAQREAKRAEEALFLGKELGILHGVPLSVKDLICTKDILTTFGSRMYEHFIPDFDETVVRRLKSAGAIILGKTNTSEFGYKAVTDNLIFGATRNVWDLERTPGGSSGGAAAAVACGIGPIGIGNDAGGSVRLPASFSGIVGFKPSRGRIPVAPILLGWESLYRRLVHIGPLTRTVRDAALVMDAIAGPDCGDPLSLPPTKSSYQEALGGSVDGLRIAWSSNLGHAVVEREVLEMAKSATHAFSELGCHVEEVALNFPPAHEAFQLLFAADCAGAIGDDFETWKDVLDERLVRLIEIGFNVSGREYVKAANRCHLLCNYLEKAFEKYDLVITPTVSVIPFPLGLDWPRWVEGQKVHPLNYIALTYPFNLTGWPAVSVPCGWTDEGLPIGLQIVGRRYGDAVVLRGAAAVESIKPWSTKKPRVGQSHEDLGGHSVGKTSAK